jgi:ATP-dependent Clp protease ATP-binding subunit ClpC
MVMREILRKELENSLQRRGLRSREWAVEWEDSAIDFLLGKGFTRDLGARPLKRAIERYLLSPLAMTIVNHQFPEGDQFLFVRSDGTRINVEFIDPDAPEPDETIPSPERDEGVSHVEKLQLKPLIISGRGTNEEVQLLREAYRSLQSKITAEEWVREKRAALNKISAEGFWESPECHRVLGEIEFMDRIESGLVTADSLLNRLTGKEGSKRTNFPSEIIRRLSQQLYLLQEAYRSYAEGIPKDAFVLIEAGSRSRRFGDVSEDFARNLRDMYEKWGKKRRMHIEILAEHTGEDSAPYNCILAVSGFGSYAILEPETGLHIWEVPRGSRNTDRHSVRVIVTAQPETPEQGRAAILNQARVSLEPLKELSTDIVRHYREAPSPLVRDSIRKWRTGNLDRVLNGDFDLFG